MAITRAFAVCGVAGNPGQVIHCHSLTTARATSPKATADAINPRIELSAGAGTSAEPEDEAVLRVPMALRRRGSGTTSVAPRGSDLMETRPSTTLVTAVARGYVWMQKLATGEIRSLKVLSELVGLPERYVSRIVRLGFLAPERVRAIWDGRQPKQVILHSLWNQPLAWS